LADCPIYWFSNFIIKKEKMRLVQILLAVCCLCFFSCESDKTSTPVEKQEQLPTIETDPVTSSTPVAPPVTSNKNATNTPIFSSKNSSFKSIASLPKYRDSLSYAVGSYLSNSFKNQDLKIVPRRMTQGYVDVIENEAGMSKQSVANYLIRVKNIQAYRIKAKTKDIPFPLSLDSVSYALGADMGYQQKGTNFEMHADAFHQGVSDVINEARPKMTKDQLTLMMGRFFNGMTQVLNDRKKNQDNTYLAAENKFFKENRSKTGMITMPSGLQYEVLKDGTGQSINYDDKVQIRYEGKLVNGDVFKSTMDAAAPETVAISNSIPGWVEGLQMMKKGAKYRFFIPSRLGYAEKGDGDKIPPNTALIYEVEIVGIVGR